MIETDIASVTWKNKYRWNSESEIDFYKRIPQGLFGVLTQKDLDKYVSFSGNKTPNDFYDDLIDILKNHQAGIAGRGTYSLGTDRDKQTLSNCFVIPIEQDSMKGIFQALENSGMTMKAGGGVGYNFSILRPKYSKIKTSGAQSTGPLSFMDIYNSMCGTIEAGGNRRGAQIAVLGVWHPDILDFITCKRKGDGLPDEFKPYRHFNLSVYISDEFMTAVKDDGLWDLVFPDTSHEAYNDEWDGNIKSWKEKGYPVEVINTVKARELWEKIMKSNYEFAEPGILFEDTINRKNTLWMREYIMATNPCGEQPLPPFASCNLGFVNLAKFVQDAFDSGNFDLDGFTDTVKKMVIMLDRMLDVNYYPLEEQRISVEQKRQIGLGFTGLGSMLAMMEMKYSSQEARDFVDDILYRMKVTAYETSVELAKKFGAFPLWYEMSDKEQDDFIKGEHIASLPETLKYEIRKYGLRNSRLLSVAPVGTMSLLVNNPSSGVEPIFLLEYMRKMKVTSDITKEFLVEDYAWRKYKEFTGEDEPEVPNYFETTNDLAVEDHLKMQAIVQKHICTSISKTINVPKEFDYESFKDIYWTAYELGLKGCTTYRPNKILGSVLTAVDATGKGCGDNRPDEITFTCAPKRPKDLPCEIHHTSIKGTRWIVIVGMYKGLPYEIFCGEAEDLYLPKSCTEGVVKKAKKGTYNLHVKIRNNEVVYKELAKVLMNAEQRLITRLLSLNLRHGIPHEFVTKQTSKSSGDITDFAASITRVLRKYIKEYKYESEKCPDCGSDAVRTEGCTKCSVDCGWSKCG